MTTRTLTLADFLLARIAEDEGAADLVLRPYGDHASTNDAEWWTREREWFDMGLSSDETPLVMRMTPQRVLAECEAKRAAIEDLSGYCWAQDKPCGTCGRVGCRNLIRLALPYADHPDYRQEWKP